MRGFSMEGTIRTMSEQLVNIALCMTLCFATWGIFYNVLHRKLGINYTEHFWWTTFYFLSAGALVVLIFWRQASKMLQAEAPVPLIVLSVFMAALLAWSLYFPRRVREPIDYFETYPDRYYLKISWRRVVAKSADIAAQQFFITLLVLFLRDAGLPLYQILLWFLFLFSLLHIPLILSEWGRWPAALFAGAVVLFSFTFPFLILYVPYGFVYTFIVHWLFYTLTASVFWSIKSIDVKI